ncbi:Holin of 3TMs, for gene-transfer release [Vreelandella subterranea]|uniref:Holin of 3TMs, for gene-transfer release n=1 Tax=Vreelandella subterranea TaxID=416874 RepID=A0A1H9VSF6_9GAMM|nr:3TM-type holin [Halomonas subterranea]SES24512.1 Holin of 3TMs, for gene-transfer release [Halomonas subterranea]
MSLKGLLGNIDTEALSGAVSKGAPLLGSLIGTPATGAAIGMIAKALGTDANPESITQKLERDPEATAKLQNLENEHQQTLTRMVLEAESVRLGEVNKTMRAEAASNDAFVRRWRPTYGYLTAAAWFIQMTGFTVILGVVAFRSPGELAAVVGALGAVLSALLGLWSIALAVLGINVHKRSQDKQVAAGQAPKAGFMDAIVKRVGG